MRHWRNSAWTSIALSLVAAVASAQDGNGVEFTPALPEFGLHLQEEDFLRQQPSLGNLQDLQLRQLDVYGLSDIADLMRENRFDLTDPAVLAALAKRGAFVGQPDPREVQMRGMFEFPDSAVTQGSRIDPLTNPLFDSDVWDRMQDLAPFLMPVGTDTGTVVFAPSPGGSTPPVGDPEKLNWSGGLDDDSCFRPASIETSVIGLSVNAARMSAALITPEWKLSPAPDGSGSVYAFPKCSADAMSSPPLHCTGLIEADGRTIWTAHHCVGGPLLGLVGPELASLQVGQSGPCDATTALRAVGVLGLVTADHVVPASLIASCESVTRVATDITRVTLSKPLPVTYGDRTTFGTWRFPRDGELATLLVPDRRLYGLGFLQSPILYDLPGGRLFPVRDCAITLAGWLPKLTGKPEPADLAQAAADLMAGVDLDATSAYGFACISTDTFNGSSGGPVFAIDDTGRELVLVGIISGANWVEMDMECLPVDKRPLQDACGATQTGRLNVMALIDAANLAGP